MIICVTNKRKKGEKMRGENSWYNLTQRIFKRNEAGVKGSAIW